MIGLPSLKQQQAGFMPLILTTLQNRDHFFHFLGASHKIKPKFVHSQVWWLLSAHAVQVPLLPVSTSLVSHLIHHSFPLCILPLHLKFP